MKVVVASWGTRGDVEPCVAVGRELLRRGHEVRMAVPPDLVGFAESAGLTAVAYGPDAQAITDAYRNFLRCLLHNPWRIGDLMRLSREVGEPRIQALGQTRTTLTSLADGADLLLTGLTYEELAANIAEHYDIPLATLHFLPVRPNGQLLSFLPAPLARSAIAAWDWLHWRVAKQLEDAQRRDLDLPKATGSWARRIAERKSLEIQAYDEVCFPGLAAEWAKWDSQRPFVGALAMELPTEADEDVASWIAAGTPPIFFRLGSTRVKSLADAVAMIGAACAQLDERAVVCASVGDFSNLPHFTHVKVVDSVNYAEIFPTCRAVVHHGGAGSTAVALRAGVPTLILWTGADQLIWGGRVKRLKVGKARRFSRTTCESLVADLRTILAPQYIARAREIATRMRKPAESLATAADLVENFARPKRVG